MAEDCTIWGTLEDGGFIGFTIRPWFFNRRRLLKDFCDTARRDGLRVEVRQGRGWLHPRCDIEVGGFRSHEHFQRFTKAWFRWTNDNARLLRPEEETNPHG